MNTKKTIQALVLAAMPFMAVAFGCSSTITTPNFGNGANTCSSVCSGCGSSATSCNTACSNTQSKCVNAGHSEAMQSLLDCVAGNNASCSGGTLSVPAACNGDLQAVSVECTGTSTFDAGPGFDSNPGFDANPGFDVNTGFDSTPPPQDTSTGGDMACITATSCIACCQKNHASGTQTFVNAVHSCECGASGACNTQCTASYCATPPKSPTMGDTCDTCLQASLNNSPPGACYNSVSAACNANADCGAYLNCANQTGCNN